MAGIQMCIRLFKYCSYFKTPGYPKLLPLPSRSISQKSASPQTQKTPLKPTPSSHSRPLSTSDSVVSNEGSFRLPTYPIPTMPATGQTDLILDDGDTYSDHLLSSDDEVCFSPKKSTGGGDGCVEEPKPVKHHTLPSRKEHEQFLRDCFEILLKDAVFDGTDRKSKLLEFQHPDKLMEMFDFKLKNQPSNHKELQKVVKEVIKHSVKPGHPYFVNQLFCGLDVYGLVGQWLTDSLNPSIYTYEVTPLFVLMEEVVLREMRKLVGFKDGEGDGLFGPGGSMSNGYAISCARYHLNPDLKTKGLYCLPRLVIFTSEDAHYSTKKLASFMGFGTDNVYLVESDCRGKMKPCHLVEQVERCIKEGAKPLMVTATCGTTVLGAFDPVEEIAEICQKYCMWLHVDAAWGGGAFMSKKHRHLLKGVEKADSVAWNAHKLLSVPQQCSAFLVKHKGILSAVHSLNATYLFQKDKFYDTKYDTGDKHIQCGRRVDVLKFWFMWKAKGKCGFECHVDTAFENSQFFLETIKNRCGFELVFPEPEFTNVCFWYIPESLRDQKECPDYQERLHKVAPKMKERMMKAGSMMVTYQAYKKLPNFFRIVFQNSALTKDDVMYLICELERLGKDL